MSSSVSGSRRSSRLRESSGEITEKNGFSVVAATRVTQRFSTPGSSASCWALLNRCTSSTNSTVSWPVATSSARAASIAARTSFTPAETADTSTKRRSVCWLRIAAIVVLPVPGGPHSSSDMDWSPSTSWRSGEPGARSWSWPTSSSSVRGRIRTASGAAACAAELSAPPPGPPEVRRECSGPVSKSWSSPSGKRLLVQVVPGVGVAGVRQLVVVGRGAGHVGVALRRRAPAARR